MAELSETDKRAILGDNYRETVATQESLDQARAGKRTTLRNTVIGIVVVAVIIVLASYFR